MQCYGLGELSNCERITCCRDRWRHEPGTIAAIEVMLTAIAVAANTALVSATDSNAAGERYAARSASSPTAFMPARRIWTGTASRICGRARRITSQC